MSDKKKNKKGFRRYEDKPTPITRKELDDLHVCNFVILNDAKRLVDYGKRVGLIRSKR